MEIIALVIGFSLALNFINYMGRLIRTLLETPDSEIEKHKNEEVGFEYERIMKLIKSHDWLNEQYENGSLQVIRHDKLKNDEPSDGEKPKRYVIGDDGELTEDAP